MSGPIPAGSPRVSAKGCGIGSARRLDDGRAAQLLEKALGLRLVLLADYRFADLGLAEAVAARRLLGADREHFDTLLSDLGRREPADLRSIQHFALLLLDVGRAADDLVAHGNVRKRAGETDSLLTVLEARAQPIGLPAPGFERGRRRTARHDEEDRAQRVLE